METNLEWGHALFTPEGLELRVPAFAFPKLRRLGVLVNNGPQLSRAIYHYLKPEYDSIGDGLRHLLGGDLSGPSWCVCKCRDCQMRESLHDRTLTPSQQDSEVDRIISEVKSRRVNRPSEVRS